MLCIQFGAWMQNFPEVSTLPGPPLHPLTGMLLTLLHQHCQTEEKETPGPGYGPLLLLTCILLIEDDKSQALRSPAADTASKESSGKVKQDGCGSVTSRGHKEWRAGKWCCCSCLSEMPWKGQDPANAPKPSLQGAPHGFVSMGGCTHLGSLQLLRAFRIETCSALIHYPRVLRAGKTVLAPAVLLCPRA